MKFSRSVALLTFAIPWIVVTLIVARILIARVPPSGVFTTETVFDGTSPFIDAFLPSERVTKPGTQEDGWTGQRIVGDPTYVTARIPGPYERVQVELEFKPLRQSLIDFGMARDALGQNLELKPLYSSELSQDEWKKVEGGFVRSDVRQNRLSDPDPRGLAVWNATSVSPRLSDPVGPARTTPVSLRGSHDFYLVSAGRDLDVAFDFQDVNRKLGATPAVIRVFFGDEEIHQEIVVQGGSRETGVNRVNRHRLYLPSVIEGVYRVALQMDDDVFIRAVTTPSRHWVVGPRLYAADVVGYATSSVPFQAWTNSRHVVAETAHREGLQSVMLGDRTAAIQRTHEVVRLDRTDTEVSPVKLSAPRGDVRFVGDGWFAFDREAFFEPKPTRLTDGTMLRQEGIEAVLTSYEPPLALADGWYQARLTFKLDPSQDRLRFVLATPGIVSRAGAVDIRRMKLRYERAPLSWQSWWSIFRHELANAWRRL